MHLIFQLDCKIFEDGFWLFILTASVLHSVNVKTSVLFIPLSLQLNIDFATEANGMDILEWQTPNESEKG